MRPTNDPTEDLLRRTLGAEPRPRLAPFFAARVGQRAAAGQGRGEPRRRHWLAVYWLALAVAATQVLAALLPADTLGHLGLVLVPAGFVLLRYGGALAGHLLAWLVPGGEGSRTQPRA